MQKLFRVLMAISAVYTLAGCPGKLKAKFASTAPISTLANSKISLVNDGAMADGTSAILVMVNLIDNENNPKAGFEPQFEVEGEGVVSTPCTQSNNEGLAICMLKASVEGTKTFKITNIENLDLRSDITFVKFEPQKPGFSAGGGSTTVSTGIKQVTVAYEVKYETNKDTNGDSVVKCRTGGVESGSTISCFNPDGSVNDSVIVYDKDNNGLKIPIFALNPDGTQKLDGSGNPIPATRTVSSGATANSLKAVSSFGEPLSLVEQKMVAEADACSKNDVTNNVAGCAAVGDAKTSAVILGKARANMQGVLNE